MAERKIILGLGNTLNKDEGVGVHLLDVLREALGENVDAEFVDGGVLGLNLLPWVEACSHLLVLDAVNANQPPGTVVELAKDEIPMYSGVKMSDHQITFQEVLGLAKFRRLFPDFLHLVGAQPVDLSIGYGLSPEIDQVMPEILARAERVLEDWGLLLPQAQAAPCTS